MKGKHIYDMCWVFVLFGLVIMCIGMLLMNAIDECVMFCKELWVVVIGMCISILAFVVAIYYANKDDKTHD